MVVSAAALRSGLGRIAAALLEAEDRLNRLDGNLGDGDLGSTLGAVARALGEAPVPQEADLGQALAHVARIIASVSGSSFSNVLMIGLRAASRRLAGRTSADTAELAAALADACQAMMERGGAQLGDKTVVDALEGVATALRDAPENPDPRPLASQAAAAVRHAFRDRPSRLGRARIAGDRSIGQEDPGMVALQIMVDAL